MWSLRLASLIALSSMEAEHIGLPEALREAIPQMHLLQELKVAVFDILQMQHKVKCKMSEATTGAIEVATECKMRPRTEHLNVKFHHFWDEINSGKIAIKFVAGEDDPADILTHPVNEERLLEHMTMSLQWDLFPKIQERVSVHQCFCV